MPKYYIRGRETRVHSVVIEADSLDEAKEIAEGMDGSDCTTDTFDDWEVMDCELVDE